MTRQSKYKKNNVPNPVVLAKSRHYASLEGDETIGCRLCKHCGCMLNTEFTQVTPDQHPQLTRDRKLILCGQRQCLVGGSRRFEDQIREVLL